MKTLFIVCTLLLSAETFACSCEGFPLSSESAMEEFVAQRYDYSFKITDENTQWVAYYPSLFEKWAVKDMEGSSCVGEGPNKVKMFHCANSRKSDYLITLAEKKCTVKMRAFSNYRSVRVKQLATTCKE